jgi:hypothetical protein
LLLRVWQLARLRRGRLARVGPVPRRVAVVECVGRATKGLAQVAGVAFGPPLALLALGLLLVLAGDVAGSSVGGGRVHALLFEALAGRIGVGLAGQVTGRVGREAAVLELALARGVGAVALTLGLPVRRAWRLLGIAARMRAGLALLTGLSTSFASPGCAGLVRLALAGARPLLGALGRLRRLGSLARPLLLSGLRRRLIGTARLIALR